MGDLVERLSKEQPIEVVLRPKADLESLRRSIERGYLHVRFLATGTELCLQLGPNDSIPESVDWTSAKGKLSIEGVLVLDYVRVRAKAVIDLARLAGSGRLEVIEEVSPAQLSREHASTSGSVH
jgi:hypothetical protein